MGYIHSLARKHAYRFVENDGIISTNADHKLVFVDLFQCVTIQQYQLSLIYLSGFYVNYAVPVRYDDAIYLFFEDNMGEGIRYF